MSLEGAIAVHRFGLGARPGEIARASGDPKAWLLAQIDGRADQPARARTAGRSTAAASSSPRTANYQRRAGPTKGDKTPARTPSPGARRSCKARQCASRSSPTRWRRASRSASPPTRPFAERLVWFWSNHFTVSAQNPRAATSSALSSARRSARTSPASSRTCCSRCATHPAMLLYLDNAQSIGPNSPRRPRSPARASTKISAAS